MKPIPCEIWVGTHWSYFKWGDYPSISAAKRYARDCITSFYEIKRKI